MLTRLDLHRLQDLTLDFGGLLSEALFVVFQIHLRIRLWGHPILGNEI